MGRVIQRKALEAYAHCCTEAEIREIVSNLTEEDQERFQTHGHIFLVRALRSNKESTAVVSALLDLPEIIPINLSETDRDGNTVFLMAVQVRDKKVVQLLLEKRLDSDPNVGNRITGNTALHETAKSADCLDILVTLLGDRRVNVNVVNNDKQTPLHVASLSRDHQKLGEVFRKIIDAARDTVPGSLPQFLGSVDHYGRTALHYVSESGNAEAVAVILEAAGDGAQKLALERDNKGHVAIHLATQTRQSSVVGLLLKFGDCEDGDGYRMIHHAVQSDCNLDMVDRCLYEHPTLKNNHSCLDAEVLDLYLELLTVTTHPNIARFLLTNFEKNHVARSWTDISTLAHPGRRLLLWAIHSDLDHSALLIEQILKWLPDESGAHLNPTTRQTALHISVLSQNVEAVKALCSEIGQLHIRGDACDCWNNTALDDAFEKEVDVSIQRMLREHRDVRSEYEKLEISSQKYVTAANTILVGSALVVALTYTHCLSTFAAAKLREDVRELGLPDLNEKKLQIVDIIVMARLAFFLAVTTTVMAAFAALPFSVTDFFQQAVDDRHVKRLLRRKSKLVMGASYFLVLSLGAVLFNFICSQLIAPYIDYKCETACHIALAVYTILSVVWLVRNGLQLWKNRTDSAHNSPVKQHVELKSILRSNA